MFRGKGSLDDSHLILSKIRTGFQKWIYRYISQCSGHKKKGNHSKRLRKVTNKTFDIMIKLREQYGIEFNDANSDWQNDHYHHEGN